jgi:hypothetical protein
LKSDRKTLGKGKTQGLLGAISDSKREAAIGKEFKKRGRGNGQNPKKFLSAEFEKEGPGKIL